MTESLSAVKFMAAVLGLTLPGYCLARSLRLRESLAAAFPFSALQLCLTVILLAALGQKITFPLVGTMLLICTVICGGLALVRRAPQQPAVSLSTENGEEFPWLNRAAVAAALLLVAAVALRTVLYPLGGFDTFTRWDALARAMLQHGSLSFYPPVTPRDFSIYFIPDGFPPLVASCYWWLYAATGMTAHQLTAISVILQLSSLLWLVFRAAEYASGRKAASVALLATIATPLLVSAVAIGQESGFMALAVAGQLCFALAANRTRSRGAVVAAALCAALGSQAREYGPALALPGFLLLLADSWGRRQIWHYLLLTAALSSPWYLRNWAITGNPLFPHALPLEPPSNEVLTLVMNYYREIFSVSTFGREAWLELGAVLLQGAPFLLLFALPCLLRDFRSRFPYLLSVLLVAVLWIWSIGQTSGGPLYSIRVLAPAMVVLAITGGGTYADYISGRQRPWPGRIVVGSLLLVAAIGILSALAHPQPASKVVTAIGSSRSEIPDFCSSHQEFVSAINRLRLPPEGIITDSPYLAVIMARETEFRPVMIWNPEISFIFNPAVDAAEFQARLRRLGIGLIAVNRSSIHNNFLARFPFYRNGEKNWSLLLEQGDDWGLFAINAGEKK